MAGAFFAENKIRSTKQNVVAGTFVSNYLDMGTNNPTIIQVPDLANNLPPGMPGSNKVAIPSSIKVISWREIL